MCDEEASLSMGAGKPIPPPLPEREEYTVDFDEMADPTHPWNWKRSKKYACILIVAGTMRH